MTLSPRSAIVALMFAVLLVGAAPASAALTVTPITWDIVGLDSNDVTTGPQDFPFAARVCTNVSTGTNVVRATFNWDDGLDRYAGHPFINLRSGAPNSPFQVTLGPMAANTCQDAYFEVRVQRNASAYGTTRRYHILAEERTNPGNVLVNSGSTPRPREAFVERLVSQGRNAIAELRWQVATAPFPPLGSTPNPLPLLPNVVGAGGAFNLSVGSTYDIQMIGSTATQGYEQFASFISFNRTIFRIIDVRSTYTANTAPLSRVPNPNDKLYADACLWQPDPNNPFTVRSCLSSGKTGGNFRTTYRVEIVGGGGAAEALNALVYDFSGSSYHYNADFGGNERIANIVDPAAAATLTKSFTPTSISAGGQSTLAITITNTTASAITGYSFTDNLPTNVSIAPTPSADSSGCGTPILTTGVASITASNLSVGANSTCTVTVRVTSNVVSSAPHYQNTIPIGNFLLNGISTNTASNTATLTVTAAPLAPPGCSPGTVFANWGFAAGGAVSAPTVDAGSLVTATAASGPGLLGLSLAGGDWSADNISTGAALTTANNDYFEFVLNTTGLTSVTVSFTADRTPQGPANAQLFVGLPTGLPGTSVATYSITGTAGTKGPTTVSSGLNPAGNTHFRIYFYNSNNSGNGHGTTIDNVQFQTCAPPRLEKSFSPNPVAVGQTSTMLFTITNPNPSNALAGIGFTDTLPAGMQVAAVPNVSATGCTVTDFSPAAAAGATSLTLSGASVAAGGTCSISVAVTTTAIGVRTNITGPISATQTGTNFASNGTGTRSLSTIAAPTIDKNFSPNPIIQGGITTLTFVITNPNPNDAIGGVAFSDPLPSGMLVATPLTFGQTGCGTPTYAPNSGDGTINFSGGSVVAGGTCIVTVNVTVPTVGTFPNTSGAVTHTVGVGTFGADTGSDTLAVEAPTPGISLQKSINGSGAFNDPWYNYMPVPLNYDVYYRFVIENVGDVNLTMPVGGWVNDPLIPGEQACAWRDELGAAIATPNPLTPGQIAVCILGPFAANFPGMLNTASVAGSFGGNDFTDTDTAEYRTQGLTVVKTPDRLTYTLAGQVINYSFTVTNTGGAVLQGPMLINDPLTSNETCPAVTTVGDLDNFFDPGEVLVCSASYTTLLSDTDPGDVVTNQASVQSSDTTPFSALSNIVNVFYNVSANPFLVVTKSISPNPTPGGQSTYTIVVTNSGTAPTSANIQISDNLPAETTYVSGSGTGWTCPAAPATNPIVCTFTGTLAANGGSTSLAIVVDLSNVAENLDNTARASGGGDPDCPAPPSAAAAHCFGSVFASTVPVTLSDVSSRVENGQLVVEFGTAIEVGTLGFRVLTDMPGQSGKHPLTAGLIRGSRNAVRPQRYEARGAFAGQTKLWIEEIAVTAKPKQFGPYPVGLVSGERELTQSIDWQAVRAEQRAFRTQQSRALLTRSATSVEVEARVDQTGPVRIAHADVQALGLDWSGARPDRIRVSRGGTAVPFSYQGGALFGPDASISFLAEAVENSLYTDTAVYRLEVETLAPNATLRGVYAQPGDLTAIESARDTFVYSPQAYYDFASPTDDPWFAFDVVRVNVPLASASRTIALPPKVDGPERLIVDLYGGLDFPAAPDHSVRIRLNGQVVATRQFDGVTRQQIAADLPSGLLVSGDNAVSVELVGDTGVYADIVLVNSIKIEYTRRLIASNNRLRFRADNAPATAVGGDRIFVSGVEDTQPASCTQQQSGCAAWRVTGLTQPDVVVMRKRAAGVDTLLAQVDSDGAGGFSASFADVTAAGDEFWIAPRSGAVSAALEPAAGVIDPIAGAPASYLIVAHPSFINGLAPLIAARRAEGLSVRVIDTDAIYRWYSAGSPDAAAIKSAIADASARLGTMYVLLVGGDTYDYDNAEGSNSVSFVPTPYRRSDALVTYAPADSVYADVDNDGKMDLAIGRFPVRTAAELDAIVAKTLAYATAGHARKALNVTDRTDGLANFRQLLFPLDGLLTGWQVTNVALSDYPPDNAGTQAARAAMVAAVNSGQALTTYFGHSAPNSWTREGLVTSQLVYGGLFANPVPTVNWQLGCWGTYFVDPYSSTVSHGLMLQSSGAAAVIGASALTEIASDMAWMGELGARLSGNRIGDALRQAQRKLAENPAYRDVFVGGTLLGDPALRLRQ